MEYSIGERRFRSHMMKAPAQFKVFKRVAKVLGGFDGADDTASNPIKSIMEGLDLLTDADIDYITEVCLAHTDIYDNGAYSPMVKNGYSIYENQIKGGELIQIVYKCLEENLSDFLGCLPLGGLGILDKLKENLPAETKAKKNG